MVGDGALHWRGPAGPHHSRQQAARVYHPALWQGLVGRVAVCKEGEENTKKLKREENERSRKID